MQSIVTPGEINSFGSFAFSANRSATCPPFKSMIAIVCPVLSSKDIPRQGAIIYSLFNSFPFFLRMSAFCFNKKSESIFSNFFIPARLLYHITRPDARSYPIIPVENAFGKFLNKYPPAKPVVFHFRAVSPNTTSGAQAALMTTWQSCDCYLLPVNGPFLCLTFFSYAFAPLFVPYFPVYFSILAFSSFFALFLIAFSFALFCSSAKPLLNPRTIRGFSYTIKGREDNTSLPFFTCIRSDLLSDLPIRRSSCSPVRAFEDSARRPLLRRTQHSR